MLLKMSCRTLDCTMQVHNSVPVILSVLIRGSSQPYGFKISLEIGITDTDLYKGFFRYFLLLAFSIID